VKISTNKYFLGRQTAKEICQGKHNTWRLSLTAKEIAHLLGGLAKWPRKLQLYLAA